jgi:hypothetical protein
MTARCILKTFIEHLSSGLKGLVQIDQRELILTDIIVKVTLGVFFGVLLVFAFEFGLFMVLFNKVDDIFENVSHSFFDSSNERLKENQDKIRAREQEIIARERAKKRIAQIDRITEIKKSEAWKSYYKDPEECLTYSSESHMVECANQGLI